MKRVLIVEDEIGIARLLCEVLEEEGYEPLSTYNGREALEAIEQRPPDIILTDIMMPVMTGAELCRRLAADVLYRDIPLILMSAGVAPPRTDDCPYAAFLAKPFELDQVVRLIKRTVGDG